MVENDFIADIRRTRRRTNVMRRVWVKEGFEPWSYQGSDFRNYMESFKEVLGGIDLLRFVQERPFPVVVDLMATTDSVRSLFTELMPDKPRLGVSVSLTDFRSDDQKNEDKRQGVIHIAGDLTRLSTWKRTKQSLNGRKIDLIMERAINGLVFIPAKKEFYALSASELYSQLNEGGGMLIAQVPTVMGLKYDGIPIEEWIRLLRLNGIDAHYAEVGGSTDEGFLGAIRITRTPNSPASIREILLG